MIRGALHAPRFSLNGRNGLVPISPPVGGGLHAVCRQLAAYRRADSFGQKDQKAARPGQGGAQAYREGINGASLRSYQRRLCNAGGWYTSHKRICALAAVVIAAILILIAIRAHIYSVL